MVSSSQLSELIMTFESAQDMERKDSLAKAEQLRLAGIQKGIFGRDTPKAATEAFESAAEIIQTRISKDESSSKDSSDRCYTLLTQIWIDYADFHLVLRDWNAANRVLQNAGEAHQKLDPTSCEETKLLQVDIYRARSIADHYLKDDNYKLWDERAIAILRELHELDASNERTAILLATFLEYTSIDEDDNTRAVESITASFNLLDQVLEQNPHNMWARRRLANTLRNGSYVFRDAKMQDQAAEAARGCVEIATELVQEKPTSPLYLFELYRCWLTLASDLVATQDDDRAVFMARTKAADAMTRLVQQVPMVAEYWNFLACTLLDIAKLQQDMKDDPALILDRAIQCAERSLACSGQDPDPEYQMDLARALSERAQYDHAQKKYTESLAIYERLYEVYNSIPDKSESVLEDFIRAMDQAHENAQCVEQMDRACLFITRAVQAGRETTSRKNRQLHASHYNDLAKLHYEQQQYDDAIEFYKQSLDISQPLFAEYPWHFYLGASKSSSHIGLARVYQAQGDIPSEVYHRRKHLKYAAELHHKDYSEWTKSSENNLDEKQLLRMRDACDSVPRMHKYTVNCYFEKANQTSPYTFYFTNPAPGKDPLEDQARVLKEDSDGVVPESVRDAVRKLQDFALKHDVSFLALLENTFGESDSQTLATVAETIEEEEKDDDDDDDEHPSCVAGMPDTDIAEVPSIISVYDQE